MTPSEVWKKWGFGISRVGVESPPLPWEISAKRLRLPESRSLPLKNGLLGGIHETAEFTLRPSITNRSWTPFPSFESFDFDPYPWSPGSDVDKPIGAHSGVFLLLPLHQLCEERTSVLGLTSHLPSDEVALTSHLSSETI